MRNELIREVLKLCKDTVSDHWGRVWWELGAEFQKGLISKEVVAYICANPDKLTAEEIQVLCVGALTT